MDTTAVGKSITKLKIQFTRFDDLRGNRATKVECTVAQLASQIADVSAGQKADLPLLKLATFGDRKWSKGSLRHDGNVTKVSGVELDYDGEVMPLEEAERQLRNEGVCGLLYTSPSHTQLSRVGNSWVLQWTTRARQKSQSGGQG